MKVYAKSKYWWMNAITLNNNHDFAAVCASYETVVHLSLPCIKLRRMLIVCQYEPNVYETENQRNDSVCSMLCEPDHWFRKKVIMSLLKVLPPFLVHIYRKMSATTGQKDVHHISGICSSTSSIHGPNDSHQVLLHNCFVEWFKHCSPKNDIQTEVNDNNINKLNDLLIKESDAIY